MTADKVKDQIGAAGREGIQGRALFMAKFVPDRLGINHGKVRNHEARIAPRRAPGDAFGLQEDHTQPRLGGMQRG